MVMPSENLPCWLGDFARHVTGERAMASVTQIPLSLFRPSPLVWQRQRIEIGRHGRCLIHPFPECRTAVDDIDRELAELVLVWKIAPQFVFRIEPPDGLEGERLDPPGTECLVKIGSAHVCTPVTNA